MVWLELEPGAAGWKAQINPLSYGGNQIWLLLESLGDIPLQDYPFIEPLVLF